MLQAKYEALASDRELCAKYDELEEEVRHRDIRDALRSAVDFVGTRACMLRDVEAIGDASHSGQTMNEVPLFLLQTLRFLQ